MHPYLRSVLRGTWDWTQFACSTLFPTIFLQQCYIIIMKAIICPFVCVCELIACVWLRLHQGNFIPLDFKAVCITGCDSGFGRLAVDLFSKRGIHVFAGCLLQDTVRELRDQSDVTAFEMDVTSSESVAKVLEMVERDCKTHRREFVGLINNAGQAIPMIPICWTTTEDFDRLYQVNLMGTIRCTLAFLPLVKAHRGRIVIVASGLGYNAIPYKAPYCTSKFGVVGFTDSLRLDLADQGVKVISIAPGMTSTPIVENLVEKRRQLLESRWNVLSEELKEQFPFEEMLTDMNRRIDSVNRVTRLNKPDAVAEAYFDAVFAKYPRSVYYVGVDVQNVAFSRLLPTEVMDAFAHTYL